MFDNIGGKLQGAAIAACFLGIIASIIAGIALMVNGVILGGILTILLGALFSWLGSLSLYGFGKLIENSDMLVAILGGNAGSAASSVSVLHQAAAEAGKKVVKTIKCPSCGANNQETNDKCFVCGKELH